MGLKVVQNELLKQLTSIVGGFNSGPYQVGLFKNDWTPTEGDTIASVQPADFSGYSGLQNCGSWPAPSWVSPRAVSNHPRITWTRDSGSTDNDIYGYYVIDSLGNLAWAERRASGPASMEADGQTYSVDLQFTVKSEF